MGRRSTIEVGHVYGYLTVLERGVDHIQPSGRKVLTYVCECACGNWTTVMAHNLRSGNTQSCGCLKARGKSSFRQGATGRDHQDHNDGRAQGMVQHDMDYPDEAFTEEGSS